MIVSYTPRAPCASNAWLFQNITKRLFGNLFLVPVVVVRRLAVEQRHFEPLALRAAILEPKLHVLGLQSRKLLAIRHHVQFLRVFEDEVVGGVGVAVEPLFQPRDFSHGVYECAIPFSSVFRGQG